MWINSKYKMMALPLVAEWSILMFRADVKVASPLVAVLQKALINEK